MPSKLQIHVHIERNVFFSEKIILKPLTFYNSKNTHIFIVLVSLCKTMFYSNEDLVSGFSTFNLLNIDIIFQW